MVDLRKIAADVVGRAALNERFGSPPSISAVDSVLLHKVASADRELLKVAASFEGGNSMQVYEDLGGSYASTVKE